MSAPLPDVAGSVDFREASVRVLTYLHEALPMAFWSVTRVENGRQTYLYLDEDNGYGLALGGSHSWEASFCIHMASGAAPAVAPDAQAVPAYAAAAVNDAVTIGSYAGAPVHDVDGSVFGVICGLDKEPRPDDRALLAAGPVLALLGQLLTQALAMERMREGARRAVEDVRAEAETDALTSLANRRGWDRRLQEAMRIIEQLGDPTVVVVVDLDRLKTLNDTEGHAAGDAHLRRAASVLLDSVRQGDLVARLGGDEFGILLRDCEEDLGEQLADRLGRRMVEAGVAASVGWAPVTIGAGLDAALHEADTAMLASKRARRRQHPHHDPVG